MPRKKQTPQYRDRIKELRRVKASELQRNEMNWRTHDEDQAGALRAVLSDIGMVSAVIAYETKQGDLKLIDGHLRADITGDEEVPVVILDVNEEEAQKILLTFDPLAELAGVNMQALTDLLSTAGQDMDDDAHLRKLLSDMSSELEKEERMMAKKEKEVEADGMPLHPHEHYDYLVVLATTTQDWNVLCDKLGLEPIKRKKKIGTCRAIKADVLLQRLSDGAADA